MGVSSSKLRCGAWIADDLFVITTYDVIATLSLSASGVCSATETQTPFALADRSDEKDVHGDYASTLDGYAKLLDQTQRTEKSAELKSALP